VKGQLNASPPYVAALVALALLAFGSLAVPALAQEPPPPITTMPQPEPEPAPEPAAEPPVPLPDPPPVQSPRAPATPQRPAKPVRPAPPPRHAVSPPRRTILPAPRGVSRRPAAPPPQAVIAPTPSPAPTATRTRPAVSTRRAATPRPRRRPRAHVPRRAGRLTRIQPAQPANPLFPRPAQHEAMRAREQGGETVAFAPTAGSIRGTEVASRSSHALSAVQLVVLAGGGFGFLLLGVAALAPALAHIAGRRARLSRTLVTERDTVTTYGFGVLLVTACVYLVVSSGP
jgi:hypothetical protein